MFTTEIQDITCDHDLQLRQGVVAGVSQENVDVSQHALLLLHDIVGPPLLVQDDEGAFWEQEGGELRQTEKPKKATIKIKQRNKKSRSFATEQTY